MRRIDVAFEKYTVRTDRIACGTVVFRKSLDFGNCYTYINAQKLKCPKIRLFLIFECFWNKLNWAIDCTLDKYISSNPPCRTSILPVSLEKYFQ